MPHPAPATMQSDGAAATSAGVASMSNAGVAKALFGLMGQSRHFARGHVVVAKPGILAGVLRQRVMERPHRFAQQHGGVGFLRTVRVQLDEHPVGLPDDRHAGATPQLEPRPSSADGGPCKSPFSKPGSSPHLRRCQSSASGPWIMSRLLSGGTLPTAAAMPRSCELGRCGSSTA